MANDFKINFFLDKENLTLEKLTEVLLNEFIENVEEKEILNGEKNV